MTNTRVVYIHNPPANTLSSDTLQRLREDISSALASPSVQAILITGNSDFFSSGADLKALETSFQRHGPTGAIDAYVRAYKSGENLAPTVYLIDQASKPVFALVSGVCFGGGLELALGCHYRICTETALLQLPEVHVGIIPGALGTQYLPRLLDFASAIELAVHAKRVDARTALSMGLVDEVIPSSSLKSESYGEVLFKALRVVERVLASRSDASSPHTRRTSALPVRTSMGDAMMLSHKTARSLPSVHRGGLAQRAALEALVCCVRAGNAFVKGALWESTISRSIVASREAHALRYVFLAERATAISVSGRRPTASIRRIGVVGAGLMGLGIAASALRGGYSVIVVEASETALAKAEKTLESLLASLLKKAGGDANNDMCRVQFASSLDALSDCDLVIEAVFEDLTVKREVFARLADICRADCLLCTNTSSLDVDIIANSCSRPGRVAGMHFFSPAHLIRLVEVVQGKDTTDETIAAVMAVSKRMGKVSVAVKNLPGFVGNRMVFNYVLESMILLEEGASVSRIDALMVEFGMAMGPFQMQDLAGLDVGYMVRQAAGLTSGARERYSRIGDELYELGRFGCKNGKGFYKYASGSRAPQIDPIVDEMVKAHRQSNCAIPTDEEIVQRLVYPLVNEALKVLEDGGMLSGRPGDVDMVFILGYGWPAFRGGVLFYGQSFATLDRVLSVLRSYSARWPRTAYFSPSLLLEAMVASNTTVFDIQRDPSTVARLLSQHSRSRL